MQVYTKLGSSLSITSFGINLHFLQCINHFPSLPADELKAWFFVGKCVIIFRAGLKHYSKACLKRPLKKDKTKVLIANGSLMKVESIAECSPRNILQHFWPAFTCSDNRSWKTVLVYFLSGRLRRVLLYKSRFVASTPMTILIIFQRVSPLIISLSSLPSNIPWNIPSKFSRSKI